MNLLEYEAKTILERFEVPVPRGALYHRGDKLPEAPVVLKSQVHSGGRGKAGGVVIVRRQTEVKPAINKLMKLEIKGEKSQTILAEEVLDVERELYLSVGINRSEATIELIAHSVGGIEVESNSGHELLRQTLTGSNSSEVGEIISQHYNLPNQSFVLQDLVQSLQKLLVASDAILCEINPLILTKQSQLVAGDCKMILDDDAIYRHPEWQFEQMPTPGSTNFVILDPLGTVATIANGAGLAMATVDTVEAAGLKPANFLDIGGAASAESIDANLTKIMDFRNVKAIIINIFGGIVRCDDVARAILEAQAKFPDLPPLYIRLSGNRSAEATKLLAKHELTLYPSLTDCLEAIK